MSTTKFIYTQATTWLTQGYFYSILKCLKLLYFITIFYLEHFPKEEILLLISEHYYFEPSFVF